MHGFPSLAGPPIEAPLLKLVIVRMIVISCSISGWMEDLSIVLYLAFSTVSLLLFFVCVFYFSKKRILFTGLYMRAQRGQKKFMHFCLISTLLLGFSFYSEYIFSLIQQNDANVNKMPVVLNRWAALDLFSYVCKLPIADHVILSRELFFCLSENYSFIFTRICLNLKEIILKGTIAWSTIGQQTNEAKEVCRALPTSIINSHL